ncbi:uncharacterized protein K441DRAFT_302563 [Cenococcum geophilum 1.58]|uniref:uncharacterized protein n=1 Tax=Cenococcum geophilum 1.58 TaxID=794803 RepID=UPI00358E2F7F|nr:hypothetical protein K441DRAFT_302563 [Cenococcum geophilum 1.58]
MRHFLSPWHSSPHPSAFPIVLLALFPFLVQLFGRTFYSPRTLRSGISAPPSFLTLKAMSLDSPTLLQQESLKQASIPGPGLSLSISLLVSGSPISLEWTPP